MTVYKFEILVAFVLAITPLSTSNQTAITPVRKLLIDTDVGGDDAVAIILALEAERLDDGPSIIGLTCVNGNTEVDHVVSNVLRILEVMNRLDIPVYKGADHPILSAKEKDYYFGEDGFGDSNYTKSSPTELVQEDHAVNAMIKLVKAYPGEITLVALGPLTNIALAIRLYSPFLEELQQLIIMGGSIEGHGNTLPNIEYNFFRDAGANFIVFNSTSKPVILVPYDTTERNRLPIDFRRSLSEFNNSKTSLIDTAERISLLRQPVTWGCPDAITIAIAVTSGSLVTELETYYLNAIYEGEHTAGMVLVDYTNYTRNAANVNIVQDIDNTVYQNLVLKYFGN